jgi:hypothetical protein
VVVVELAEVGDVRALELEQVGAELEARGHFGEGGFVGVEAGGIERAHGGEKLLAGFDADAGFAAGGGLGRGFCGGAALRERREGGGGERESGYGGEAREKVFCGAGEALCVQRLSQCGAIPFWLQRYDSLRCDEVMDAGKL